jgi:hypothetical protein
MARPRVGGHPVEAQCSRLSRSFRQACWKPVRQVRRRASAALELGTREHQRICECIVSKPEAIRASIGETSPYRSLAKVGPITCFR